MKPLGEKMCEVKRIHTVNQSPHCSYLANHADLLNGQACPLRIVSLSKFTSVENYGPIVSMCAIPPYVFQKSHLCRHCPMIILVPQTLWQVLRGSMQQAVNIHPAVTRMWKAVRSAEIISQQEQETKYLKYFKKVWEKACRWQVSIYDTDILRASNVTNNQHIQSTNCLWNVSLGNAGHMRPGLNT